MTVKARESRAQMQSAHDTRRRGHHVTREPCTDGYEQHITNHRTNGPADLTPKSNCLYSTQMTRTTGVQTGHGVVNENAVTGVSGTR